MLRPACKPNIPPTERMRFSKCAGCHVVQQKSIDITDMDTVTLRVHSQFCSDMVCTKCGTTTRLFYIKDTAFAARVQPGAEPPVVADRNDPMPLPVRRLLSHVRKDPPESVPPGPRLDNDTDLERMFGSNAAPVVGSYKDDIIMINTDVEAVISGKAPKSYFA